MEHEDLEPIKQVIFTKEYAELEWTVPITDDHVIKISKHNGANADNWAVMKRWCEQNCEDTVVIWTGAISDIRFHFFRKTDAMAFKLRWL